MLEGWLNSITDLNEESLHCDSGAAVNKGRLVAKSLKVLAMARMYSSSKGVSGSSKPFVESAPEWSNTDEAEIEEIVLNLARQGKSTAEIGTILRDQHAVPDIRLVAGKRMSKIIEESGASRTYPEDMMNLMRKVVNLLDHLGDNRKDLHNRRALEIVESKIRRLAKYYSSEGTIPSDWKYQRDQVRLMVE